MSRDDRRYLVLLLALLLAASALADAWRRARTAAGMDFFVIWAITRSVAAERVDDVYSAEGRKGMGAFYARQAADPGTSERQRIATHAFLGLSGGEIDAVASPFLYWIFTLFENGDYERDYKLYTLFRLALWTVSLAILCHLLRFPLAATLLLIALTTHLLAFGSDLRVGNVNQIQVGMIAVFLALQAKPTGARLILSGAVLGAAVLFKPTLGLIPMTVLPIWLARRRFRKALTVVVGMAAGGAAAVAGSAVFFGGLSSWGRWVGRLAEVQQIRHSVRVGNYGLAGLIDELTGRNVSVVLVIFLLVGYASILLVHARRPRAAPRDASPGAGELFDTALAVALGCALILLCSSLVWLHYYLLAVPLIVFDLHLVHRYSAGRRVATAAVVCAAVALLTSLPFIVLTTSNLVHAGLANAAVLLLVGVAVSELLTPSARGERPASLLSGVSPDRDFPGASVAMKSSSTLDGSPPFV